MDDVIFAQVGIHKGLSRLGSRLRGNDSSGLAKSLLRQGERRDAQEQMNTAGAVSGERGSPETAEVVLEDRYR